VLPEAEEDAETVTKSASDRRSSRRDAAMEPAANEDIIDTDELAEKLDEVNNREDHRVKGGRELKASS
jgi:small subunit ribosomal protein S2